MFFFAVNRVESKRFNFGMQSDHRESFDQIKALSILSFTFSDEVAQSKFEEIFCLFLQRSVSHRATNVFLCFAIILSANIMPAHGLKQPL